ncbi:tudor domain-containing protein 15, partial [Anguilla anguilla]|uniref:tudor domain-containing protein 15 n=1 Tax=Anguilla anguilla TaxID=7936 RepID=UPI0015AB18FB
MLSRLASGGQRTQADSDLAAPCALWPVDLKLTHVDCNPEDTLVHFQGQYLTICELDYNILQVEIQNAPKTKTLVEISEFCLVEDVLSGRWYRGRVQNKHSNLYDVFLLDHGNILTVNANHMASASEDLFMLPPKIVCGFFANVLPLQKHWHSLVVNYFSSLIGSEIKGYIQGLLPHKVLILEAPAVNKDLLKLGLGKHADRDTFLLLVEMLTEVPLKQSSESVPDLLIEKQIGQEFSFKHSSSHGFENILSFCSPKLSVGKNERARVTAAVNPRAFYCQLRSMEKDLKEMSGKLSLACESKSKAFSDKNIGNLGLLCSVKGKDEKWHRGFVQYLPVNSQVRVLFVDYGYCESVRVENILQLPSEFLSVPIAAFPCALSCLSEQDEVVLKKQLNYLKTGLLGDELEIQIDSFNVEQNLYSVTLHAVTVDVKKTKSPECETTKNDSAKDVKKNSSQNRPLLQYTSETEEHISSNAKYQKEIKEDCIFEGFVEHVLNPTNFWLRTEERNRDFEDMMQDMSEYFRGLKLDEGILENPVPGALCCAMYEKDMHYYRALVIEMIENGAEVYFIDFGNTEKVPYMLIKTLPPRFELEPAFALKCSLSHVVPVEDVWTVSATNYFREIVSNKALLVHVVHKRKHEYVVDLYERGNQKVSIALLLTKAKMAEYWKCLFPEPVQFDRPKAGKLEQRACKDSGPGNGSQSNSSGISGIYQNVKSSELPAQHTVKPVSATTQLPKQNIHAEIPSFKVLTFKPGAELAVRCSQVNSPSDIWCQLQSKLSELDELMEKIQGYYQTHADPWQQNEACCIVKCPSNGKWYRGCILCAQDGEFDVILVDTGMIVKEKTRNLRAIKAEYLELAGQAFRCSIYNIEPGDSSLGVWHINASNILKKFTEDNSQNLKCTIYTQLVVKSKGLSNAVDLHTPFTSATKLLIHAGLAREVQSPKQLIPSVYPYSYTYSLFNVNIGSKEQVHVTHVCSPWEIYCQLDKIGTFLDDLMEQAQKTSGEMQSLPPAAHGRLCLAKYFMDGQWYRGLAYPVQSSLHLNVFFVDYGNMQVVEKCNVLPIPRHATDLLFVPMLALRCSLSDVPKGELLADVNCWLEKAVLNKLVQAAFVGKDEEGTILCDLFDGSLHVNQKVKEIIAKHGHKEETSVNGQDVKNGEKIGKGAEALKIVVKTREGSAVKAKKMAEKNKSCLRTRHTSGRTTSKKSSKLKVNSTNSQKENESRVCHFETRRNGHTHLKANETIVVQNHKIKVSCGHLKQPTPGHFLPNLSHLPESKVKPGFRGTGFVSHVNTVTSFYIQMEDDEQAILKMGEDLNDAQLKETMENITGKLNVGDVIACEYEEDGALYRAVAINVSDAKIKVEFIDYGNEATVDSKNARRLPGIFLTQPRLSIPCLQERSQTLGCDTSFALAVAGKPLRVEFVRQCGPQWAVSIDVCEVSPSLRGVGECSIGEEDCNPLETEKEPVPEHMTKGKKEAHNCCLDTLGVQIKEMASRSTENAEECAQEEMSQHFVHHATMKTLPDVTSQCSPTVQDVDPVFTLTERKKGSFLLKSSKNVALKKQHIKNICQRKHKALISKQLLRPFHHSGDKIKQMSIVNPESMVSHVKAVHSPSEHICEATEEQTKCVHIPHQNITAGQTENGTLLSFLENGDLYVQLHRNSKLLALLDTLIAEQSLSASTISKVDIKEGLECLVKSNRKNHWYRAAVQKASEVECSVFLVDHGTTEVVSLDCIKELCTELQQIPKQAVLCKWNDPGCPIEGAHEMLKETLNPLVEQKIKLMFVSYSETSQIWFVEIMINGIFLLQQHKKTCLEHSAMDSTSVDETNCAQRLSLAPVELDLGHTGFAAAVTAPCEFHVVLEDMLLVMSKVSTILETLPEDLDSVPEAVLAPGTGCLVKCETKKKWCRAEIVHVDSTSVVINLVDYGHCACLPCTCRGQLKRLPEELAKLPKVTHPCVLRGVKPAGVDVWTDEAVVFFQERVCQKSLIIYFRQYVSEAQWEVDIVSSGVNVAMELVAAGYATYIDSMLGLRLQPGLSPIGVSRLKFNPRVVRSTLKLKPAE